MAILRIEYDLDIVPVSAVDPNVIAEGLLDSLYRVNTDAAYGPRMPVVVSATWLYCGEPIEVK